MMLTANKGLANTKRQNSVNTELKESLTSNTQQKQTTR